MPASTPQRAKSNQFTSTTDDAGDRGQTQVSSGVYDDILSLHRSIGNGAVTRLLQSSLEGAGQPLERPVLKEMEARFSEDFSDVRIHTDLSAARSARTMRSNAFTLGRNVVFGAGKYAPEHTQGKRLLAHELAHVLQQRRGGGLTGYRSPALGETEADRVADSALAGESLPKLTPTPLGIQCQGRPGQEADEPIITLHFFKLYWVDQVPPIEEIKRALVAGGFVDGTVMQSSKAVPEGNPTNPTGWSFVHPRHGEVTHLTVTRDEFKGRKIFSVHGFSDFPGQSKGPTGGGTGTGTTHGPDGGTPRTEQGKPITAPQGATGQQETGDEIPTRDYDTLLKDNPQWQRMSKEDRKLLQEYAKMSGEDLSKQSGPAPSNKSVKLSIALRLASGWPEEIKEAAKNAFTDPGFVIMLVLTLGIYVGLWLVPDPSLITKVAAGVLTAVLLLQFAWEDIYGLAKAWFDLEARCDKATTIPELKAAGDEFSRKVGSVGFDILLFIATWGLGKAVGPKLAKVGAARNLKVAEGGVKTAETKVATAESQPGTGVKQPATPESARLIDTAKANAKGTTATAVLDALAELLPKEAQAGLKNFRNQIAGGDLQVLKALEGRNAAGENISKFLADRGVSPDVQQAARAEVERAQFELDKANLKLARAKLIESRTIKDPQLRENVRQQQYSAIKMLLQKIGAFDTPEMVEALKKGDTSRVVAELQRVLRQLTQPQVAEAQGAVGEAMQRTQLQTKYANRQGVKFFSNIAIVRRVAGYRSINEWRVAEEARIKQADPAIDPAKLQRMLSRGAARYFEYGGELYESVAEVDALVTEPGAKGKPRPVEVAEVKTGRQDRAGTAAEQLDKAVDALKQLGSGQGSDLKIFELKGKNQLGTEMTDAFDLARLGQVQRTAVGAKGEAFPTELELTVDELAGLARSLVTNLPPAKPQTIPPTALPRQEKRE